MDIIELMVGVDEVGRGCLAGPLLVVAARAKGQLPVGLKDSKLLSRRKRQEMLNLLSNCCEFGEGWVSVAEIDSRGLAAALRLGVARALKNLGAVENEEILLDGIVNYAPKKFKKVVCFAKADNLVPIVSAASIYAKVKRDSYMINLAKKYPSFSFHKHVGYGTAQHHRELANHGVLNLVHRTSFAFKI